METKIYYVIGLIISFFTTLIGGFTGAVITLTTLILLDYVTGLTVAFANKSVKSEFGGIDSKVGFRGIAKKVMILILVAVGHQIDSYLGTTYLRDAVCITYICNEITSIIENASLLGIPIPDQLLGVIDVLKKKDNKE